MFFYNQREVECRMRPQTRSNKISMTSEERRQRLEEARTGSDSWKEWYRLTPLERMRESMKLWQFYLAAGGSLDPEPDSQSPFDAVMSHGTPPAYKRSGLLVIRRSGV